MLARMMRRMQELPGWPVTICGDAAMRAILRIAGSGAVEPNPLPPGEATLKNPLPGGEGEIRGAHGTVIAVFARSFYLGDATGGLVCIGPPGLGRGPLNMLCDLPRDLDWLSRGLCPGMVARRDGTILRIDGIGAFSLDGAAAWRPAPPPGNWSPETLAAGLEALAAASPGERTDGFAPLVAPLARGRFDELAASPTTAPLRRLAVPAIATLAEWLAAGGEGAPDEAAAMLIGLGPGLTPSGDDLLGGAMIALHATGRAAAASRLAAWALPLAETRTGAISRAHLVCAAAGEGSASLHEVLAALLTGDVAALAEAVAALGAIGHSSGWDMLAGATLACAAVSV
jgi:Protein of unknown function (DUF2877)